MAIAYVTRNVFNTDRRRALTGFVAGVTVPLMAFSPLAGAGKKHKHRKHKKRQKPPLTCQELCPNSDVCFHRAGGGPPLCGYGFGVGGCAACSSDQACVGLQRPYCITSFTESADNETHEFPQCGDYDIGLCTEISLA
jgi:hypothetical protein